MEDYGLGGNPRTRELTAVSEDDLLAQQEAFAAHLRRPAATVTRVTQRSGLAAPAPSPAIPAETGHGGPGPRIRGPNMVGDTEDDILRMQEEFISQHSRPSARVTRIGGAPRPPTAAVSPTSAAGNGSANGGDASSSNNSYRDAAVPPKGQKPGAPAGASAGSRPGGPQPGPGLESGSHRTAAAVQERMDRACRGRVAGAQGASEPSLSRPGYRGSGEEGVVEQSGPAGAGEQEGGERGQAAQQWTEAAATGAEDDSGQQQQEPPPDPKSILAPIEGLLGDIMERPSVAPDVGNLAAAAAAGAGGGAFPEATHRRQSKFALSRKAKQQPQPHAASTAPSTSLLPGPSGPGAASRGPTSRSLSNWSVLPSAPEAATATQHGGLPYTERAAAAVAPSAGVGTAAVAAPVAATGGEDEQLASMRQRNLEAVYGMRPEEVAAAVDELSSRLSPEAMEFLRRRGAQRLAGTAPPPPPQQPPLRSEEHGAHGSGRVVERRGHIGAGGGGSSGVGALGLTGRALLSHNRGGDGGGGDEPGSCVTQEHGNALIDSALRALTNPSTTTTTSGGSTVGAEGRSIAPLTASVAAPGNPAGSMSVGALAAVQQQQEQRQQGQGGAGCGTAAAGAGAGARGSPADPRLVARLRFDLHGGVVDVQSPDEVFVEEEVLLRDQLRRDEGSAPPGYTLGELLVLCRSAVAPQRAAGLQAIADLAATARPRPEDLPLGYQDGGEGGEAGRGVGVAAGQMMRRFVPIPEELRSSAPAGSVSWQEVWQFFVSELGLVAHLRLALDDDRPGVVAAAAAALAAVLAQSESEILSAEMSDLCPATGWPAPPSGYMARHGLTAPWEAQPPVQQPPPAHPHGGRGGGGCVNDDEPDLPEEVALVDPLSGALQMGLLQRVRYLLASRLAPAAHLPLLAVLCAAARSGSEVALAVAREPGLLAAVNGLLDPAAVASAAAGGGGWGATGDEVMDGVTEASGLGAGTVGVSERVPPGAGGGADTRVGGGLVPGSGGAVAVAAMMFVRLMCAASSVVAQLVRSADLLAHIPAFILLGSATTANATAAAMSSRPQTSSAPAPLELDLLRLEALRTWRVAAHHGISVASLDDLYGNMCQLLPPPLPSAPTGAVATSAGAATPAAVATVRQLTVAEVYLLLGSLVRHSVAVAAGDITLGRSMLGPGAAAVIATEALAWLKPSALRSVAAAAVSRYHLSVPLLSTAVGAGAAPSLATATGPSYNGGPSGGLLRTLLGAHPAVLLPPAAAHVACLAAVMSYLATYWSTVATSQPVFGDVRQAVSASGLLRPQEPSMLLLPQSAAAAPTDVLAMALLRRRPEPECCSSDGACSVSHDEAPTEGCTQRLPQSPSPSAKQAGGDVDVEGGGGAAAPEGRALAAWALAVMGSRQPVVAAAKGTSGGSGGGGGGEDGLRLRALAGGCLQVAAASFLYSTLQLAAAVHRDDSATCATTGRLAAAVVTAAAPLCCQAAAAAPPCIGRVMCPWHVAALQRQLHITRLLVLAGTLLPAHSYTTHNEPQEPANPESRPQPDQHEPPAASKQPAQEASGTATTQISVTTVEAAAAEGAACQGELQTWLLEGCLAALSTSPPGAEGLCLSALRLGLREGLLRRPLAAAYDELSHLPYVNPKLALAAAGAPYNAALPAAGDGGLGAVLHGDGVPFPMSATPPAAAEVAEVLFESYAASWLSLISQRRLPASAAAAAAATPTGDCTTGAAASSPPPPPSSPPLPQIDLLELTPVSLQGQRGSRLPAPSQWAMLEAHRLPRPTQPLPPPPQQQQQQGQQQQGPQNHLNPVGCALLLCLGREACESVGALRKGGGGGGVRGARGTLAWLSEGPKLQAALQAAYLFRANEMVPQDADEAAEGSWREPFVRWALAGLSQRYLCGVQSDQARPPGPPGPDWLPAALAERLVTSLGVSCFGDPLLGAHLALELAHEASPVVRLQVWNGLAADKSLHLLPPTSRCLGGATLYLPPPTGGATSPPAATSSTPPPDPAFLAALQRSLIEGDLDRALLTPTAPTSAPTPSSKPDKHDHPDVSSSAILTAAPTTTSPSTTSPSSAASTASPAACCCSVSGDVALHHLATHLLCRDNWPALARALKTPSPSALPALPAQSPTSQQAASSSPTGDGRGVSTSEPQRSLAQQSNASENAAAANIADKHNENGRDDKGEGEGAVNRGGGGGGRVVGSGAVPPGAAMLGGLVRSARPEVVARLVLFAEGRCGIRREEAAAVLAQTCAGETGLRERVRQVLALCGLV